jgi:O-antigen ligase
MDRAVHPAERKMYGFGSKQLSLAQWFLILGCVLSSATQLRFVGGLGAGEIFVLIYSFIRTAEMLGGAPSSGDPVSRQVSRLWGLWIVSMALGCFWAELSGADLSPGVGSDSLKLFFVGLFVVQFYRFELADTEALLKIFRIVILSLTCVLLLLYFVGFVRTELGPITLFYGPRFSGWAKNPNQTALAVVAIPWLSLGLLSGKLKWVSFFGSIVILIATKSDGAQLAIAVGAIAIIFRFYYSAVKTKKVRGSAVGGFLFIAVMFVLYGESIYHGVQDRIDSAISEGGGGGNGRATLWAEALKVGLRSPVVGYGPGSRLRSGYLDGLEAHNVYLDLFVMGGLLSAGALILFQWGLLRRAWNMGSAQLGAVLTVTVMAFTGLLIRHPLFWVFLAAFEVAPARKAIDSRDAEGVKALRPTGRWVTKGHSGFNLPPPGI